jgi:hypothetical protein
MLGRLSQRESRRVILHLLSGCPGCREVTAVFWNVGVEDRGELSERFRYDSTVSRVVDRVRDAHAGLETERAEARRLMVELEARSREEWPTILKSDPRFHTWGACELLLDRAHRAHRSESPRDVGESALCAGLAISLAGRIDTAVHPQALVHELTARAWTSLADFRRLVRDLHGAEEALRRAEAHLLRGTGDRLERARVLEGKAALRIAQERPEEAARLLSRAILLYRRTGQWDRVGRIFQELGCIRGLCEAGEQEIHRSVLSLWLEWFGRLRRISARLLR